MPKTVITEKEKKKTPIFSGKYFYGLGKRKTAVARVRIFLVDKRSDRKISINGKELANYFPVEKLQLCVNDPFVQLGQADQFDVLARVSGGGFNAQAESLRLAISRALVKFDEGHKKILKGLGYLTRDSRAVERKKPGRKKARRSPQWAKR